MTLCVYSIRTYEKKILDDYYCQIVTHEVCDEKVKQQWFSASPVYSM
jgi:hypothetical protein